MLLKRVISAVMLLSAVLITGVGHAVFLTL